MFDSVVSKYNHKINLHGRSGCKILLDQDDLNLVVKISRSVEYNNRLERQYDKQINFYKNYRMDFFDAPEIFSSGFNEEGLYHINMKYIPGESYSEYLIKISKNELDDIIDSYIDYFERMINFSTMEIVPKETIISKIISIRCALKKEDIFSDNIITKVFDYLINNIPYSQLPIGFCHGDFTFSNIIFSNDRIFLIDFLDSFIESPIIDIVKLRQDTKFHWSILLEENMPGYQKLKLLQILRYFDNRIIKWFCNYNNFHDWYVYLELMNLLRILPYLENKNEIDFIFKSLKGVLI